MRIPSQVFLTILLGCFFMHSQNRQLLYDFTDIPQSLMVNPAADVDFKWYGGVPLLSGLSLQAGSSGVSAFDLIADDGLDINVKVRDRLLDRLTISDEVSGTYQIELLNIGWRGKDPDYFYSFGIYNEGDGIGYWFKDYATLGFDGNADTFRRFDLSHLKTRGSVVNVYHFGVKKRVSDKLLIGGRAKIYSGILDFNSTRNKGFLQNTEGQNNLLSTTLDADLELRTSGLNEIRAADGEDIGSVIAKRALFGGDLGLGLDLGFTSYLNEQTVFTASLLDLGFIYHSSDAKNYTINGRATSEGVEIILPGALLNPDEDFYQELVDNIEALTPFEENLDSYLTFRPTKLNVSLRYNFGKQIQEGGADCDCGPYASQGRRAPRYANAVGGQLYAINRPRGPQTALTAFYLRRFGNVAAIKATYTIDKFSLTNIGLGLNLQAGPVNLYFIADNIIGYQNIYDSRYASFQLGLNIISWGKK